MAFISGPRGGRPKPSQPSLLNTLPDVLQHCLQVERTAVAVLSSISNSQLRPPSLIADAPLKLWLKLLDFETLEVLHNKSVAASAKAKLLGQRDETAYRVNRIRRLPIVSLSTGERNRRLAKVLRWARKRSNQELSDYIARFPKPPANSQPTC